MFYFLTFPFRLISVTFSFAKIHYNSRNCVAFVWILFVCFSSLFLCATVFARVFFSNYFPRVWLCVCVWVCLWVQLMSNCRSTCQRLKLLTHYGVSGVLSASSQPVLFRFVFFLLFFLLLFFFFNGLRAFFCLFVHLLIFFFFFFVCSWRQLNKVQHCWQTDSPRINEQN